jgi:osmoprotectant transport system permease protein
MNIGITSIAAYIGAGGLGTLIFRGISTVDSDLILAGAVPIAALSVAADWLLRKVERLLGSDDFAIKKEVINKC